MSFALLKIGPDGRPRVTYFGRRPNFHNGDTYYAELVVWPLRLQFGGTGVYAGFRVQLREKGVDPPLWRTVWPRKKLELE